MLQPRAEQENLVSAVIREKCSQQISLVPTTTSQHIPRPVFEGPPDVVEMDEHPHLKKGKDAEDHVIDVAAHLRDMATIHEQDIPRRKCLEAMVRNVLDSLFEDFNASIVGAPDEAAESARVGICEGALNLAPQKVVP